jgi:hypothetical protein
VSFGVVSADHVERTPGPSARALSGVTHGISGLVPPGRAQILVTVTLTNLRRRRVQPYSPALFTLRAGRGRPLAPAGATVRPGTLQPGASIQGRVAFVVPRSGRRLVLTVHDPGGPPVAIRLGRVTRLRGAPPAGHVHGGSTP